jgi:hypothetical protein
VSRWYTGYLLYGFAVDRDAHPSWPDENGCERVTLGADDEEAEFLCAVKIDVCRNNTVTISLTELQQKQPDAYTRLKNYCELHGIEFKEPSWQLATSLL